MASMLTVLSCGNLKAQTGKGKFLIGDLYRFGITGYGYISQMNIGFGTNTYKSDNSEDPSSEKFLTLNFIPKAGYFFADNLAVGLDMNLMYLRNKDEHYTYSVNMLGAGPFIRYYYPMDRVMPFLEVNSSFGRGRNRSYSDATDNEYESVFYLNSFGCGTGIAILLSQKVSFDVIAGYNRVVMKDLEDNDLNYRHITESLGLKLGFTVILGSK